MTAILAIFACQNAHVIRVAGQRSILIQHCENHLPEKSVNAVFDTETCYTYHNSRQCVWISPRWVAQNLDRSRRNWIQLGDPASSTESNPDPFDVYWSKVTCKPLEPHKSDPHFFPALVILQVISYWKKNSQSTIRSYITYNRKSIFWLVWDIWHFVISQYLTLHSSNQISWLVCEIRHYVMSYNITVCHMLWCHMIRSCDMTSHSTGGLHPLLSLIGLKRFPAKFQNVHWLAGKLKCSSPLFFPSCWLIGKYVQLLANQWTGENWPKNFPANHRAFPYWGMV